MSQVPVIHKSGGGALNPSFEKLYEGDCSIPAHTGYQGVEVTGGALTAEQLAAYGLLLVEVTGAITAQNTDSNYKNWWAGLGCRLSYSSSTCSRYDTRGNGTGETEVCIRKMMVQLNPGTWFIPVTSVDTGGHTDTTTDPLVFGLHGQTKETVSGAFHVKIYGMRL